MLYRGKKVDTAFQSASYVGRVSFGQKDAESTGLMAGDVSLMLTNATLQDAGEYICYVSSDQGYDTGSVKLTVTETGTSPLMSPVWKEDNMVNVSCESEGWYPKPSVRWSDQQKVVTPKSVKYGTDSSGLVSVHSWLLVSKSSEVSCSVSLSGEETKEARMRLENHPQPGKQASSSSGWVAFAVLLTAMLAAGLVGFLYYKKKGRLNVTLDQTENPYLRIRDLKMRDTTNVNFPDGQNVTCLTAIKGTPGFSSGQHYWEVSMGKPETGLKQSWWLGVTSASEIPQGSDLTPAPSDGYLFLSSSPDRANHFQFNTEPNVLLPVCSRPQTVGVYLNFEQGELSFYDVQNKSHIGSLKARFTGEVFPLFNPGKYDRAPMEILHRDMTAQGQSDNTENGDPPISAGKNDSAYGGSARDRTGSVQ
ncbi:Butyrophilin subfamily 2 member A2 [Nibea albiflora]|uniref:Butyrophilin subfamily 2 member A2 n=1 Tax=Nibea albiflora TaxID=240163 RepID=A0ACB7EV87_NIBAL|nr:Butyrophilin subfamily 2 member A2 [Nibea albiflora]